MQAHQRALANAKLMSLWHDCDARPAQEPPLDGDERCELLIVGGGFTGLWAALQLKEQQADADIVLIEKSFIADGASGRNGGFLDASLAHGEANIALRFADEADQLASLAEQNIRELLATIERYNIDARYEKTGMTSLAMNAHSAERLHQEYLEARAAGEDAVWYDRDAARLQVNSPRVEAACWYRGGYDGVLDPARLCWGLKAVLKEQYNVRIYEGTAMLATEPVSGGGMRTRCTNGVVTSDKVLIATNGYTSPIKKVNRSTIPIWDYQIATQALTDAQFEQIAWGTQNSRHALEDYVNMFHYFRLTQDGRITWGGGGDVRYYFNRGTHDSLMDAQDRHERLAKEFFEFFPQLEGEIEFTHRWGGIIGSSTRFCMVPDTAYDGRVAWTVGYTGLGVCASRFGARIALELLGYQPSSALQLKFIAHKALPWAPEPLRWLGVKFTQYELQRADRNGGRRGLWLKLLDKLGLGFAC